MATTMTRSESLKHSNRLVKHLERKLEPIRAKQASTPKYMSIYYSLDRLASSAEVRLLKLRSWNNGEETVRA